MKRVRHRSTSNSLPARICNNNRKRIVQAGLAALTLLFVCQIALAQAKPSNSKLAVVPLTKVVEAHFAHWDRNHNDALDLMEVDDVIEDHSVHGRQAAPVVCLRRHMTAKDSQPTLSHQQLLKLVEEHDFSKQVEQATKHLETIERELFLSTDPDLTKFNQGRLNDCYLLSAIAAQAHRNPTAIRGMIHPEVTGGFQVLYGDGQKIQVTPLTESELLLGASLNDRHGSWLAVLEKSYGVIRKRDQAKKKDKAVTTSGSEPIATLNWGNSGVIISLLTGHQTQSMPLGKSHPDQVHELLTNVTKKKHLVCTGTNHDKVPPGMGGNHAYAILGYDANSRHVNVFNPWGNNFTPKGSPGKSNGYATKNGHFTVPLDEFHIVFSNVVYETDKPLAK